MTDELLATLDAFHKGVAEFNSREHESDEDSDLHRDQTFGPHLCKLETWDKPATTYRSAIAALRFAKQETQSFAGVETIGSMLSAALGYFDNPARQAVTDAEMSMADGLDLSSVKSLGWLGVYDGLTLAIEAIQGVMRRPQCGNGRVLNASGEYLDAIANFLTAERRRAMETLQAKPVDMASDPDLVLKLLLHWKVDEADGEFDSIIAAAKDAKANQAIFDQRRKSR
ncbi:MULTISPECIES: hypothetical protein [unclassified Rhizobium]|uniref:hypothetical protein n=1 Tax=unclassified Rhizobium TaxID=2613769 RepID=UPI00115F67E8|nr:MULTISPECIES: hypothetical protein [unclassified Rhizobium]TQX88461.1 hypothetical protein EQW76_11540 [Rhizobium sp. rho-13.1]TQY12656.1 hypothetical protein EQW74_15185 [Rhizobium sp. rho-1.1]